jgi:hypothetical protein
MPQSPGNDDAAKTVQTPVAGGPFSAALLAAVVLIAAARSAVWPTTSSPSSTACSRSRRAWRRTSARS